MDKRLIEEYEFGGKVQKAHEICDKLDIPYNVFLWRRVMNMCDGKLFQKAVLYEVGGVKYTVAMLQSLYGINAKTIRSRHKRGFRGFDLLGPVPSQTVGSVTKPNGPHECRLDDNSKAEAACRKQLKLLIKHHKLRAVHVLKYGIHPDDADHGFDGAAARLNAMRLENAARYDVRRKTHMLEVA